MCGSCRTRPGLRTRYGSPRRSSGSAPCPQLPRASPRCGTCSSVSRRPAWWTTEILDGTLRPRSKNRLDIMPRAAPCKLNARVRLQPDADAGALGSERAAGWLWLRTKKFPHGSRIAAKVPSADSKGSPSKRTARGHPQPLPRRRGRRRTGSGVLPLSRPARPANASRPPRPCRCLNRGTAARRRDRQARRRRKPA